MGKRSRKDAEESVEKVNGIGHNNQALLVDNKAVDPALALLFASSVRKKLLIAAVGPNIDFLYRPDQFKLLQKPVMSCRLLPSEDRLSPNLKKSPTRKNPIPKMAMMKN